MRVIFYRASLMTLLLCVGIASAAQFPNHPIRIVVPYSAGGGTDILTRLIGKQLEESWKQPVIVDNRPGASGLIGMDIIARAEPTGYSLLAIAAGPLDEHNLKYFSPIALFSAPPYLFVVHPSVKAKSIKE